jgi:quercetin dioxygenase-like cupin family protein
MADGRYVVAALDDIERLPAAGALTWMPVRRHLGVAAFGLNAYTAAAPGDEVIEDHTESGTGHQEVYLVLRGRARFTLDGEEVTAAAGTFVFLPEPAVRRHAVAEEAGTAVLAIGGKPGEAFRVSPWEYFFAGYARAAAGDPEEAERLAREGLEQYPGHPVLTFHLACFETMAGHEDAALEHLREAAERDPRVAAWAAEDEDLAPLRGRPGFPVPAEADRPGDG